MPFRSPSNLRCQGRARQSVVQTTKLTVKDIGIVGCWIEHVHVAGVENCRNRVLFRVRVQVTDDQKIGRPAASRIRCEVLDQCIGSLESRFGTIALAVIQVWILWSQIRASRSLGLEMIDCNS
jgi:hypothetical protein